MQPAGLAALRAAAEKDRPHREIGQEEEARDPRARLEQILGEEGARARDPSGPDINERLASLL